MSTKLAHLPRDAQCVALAHFYTGRENTLCFADLSRVHPRTIRGLQYLIDSKMVDFKAAGRGGIFTSNYAIGIPLAECPTMQEGESWALFYQPEDELPTKMPDGDFSCFSTWVNKAASWIGGTNPLCADAKGRICRNGGDFMRADKEGAFPVRYWLGEGPIKTKKELDKSKAAARRNFKLNHGYDRGF